MLKRKKIILKKGEEEEREEEILSWAKNISVPKDPEVETNRKWTKEKVFEESRKYSSRNEFNKGSSRAYDVARENKWLDKMTWLIPNKKPNGYWNNKENVFEESKKYTTRSEFRKESERIYEIARRNNWLDDMIWLTGFTKKPKGYWTKERVFEESKKYTYRNQFQKGCSSAYGVAKINKWLDEMTWLKDCKTLEGDQVDCIYVYRFLDQNAIYVGRTVRRKERDYDHHTDEKDAVYIFFTKNSLPCPEMEIIEDNLTLLEGSEREGYWVKYYKEKGWIILNRKKTGGLGAITAGKWDYDSCKTEASKYKNRGEFNKNSRGAYDKSRKKGWLDEFFPVKNIHIKAVDQLDLEGNYLRTFSSITEAGKSIEIDSSGISNVLKGKQEIAGGYKWRYHNKD